MKTTIRILAVLIAIAALMFVALPTQASTGSAACSVSPGSGPVGTVFAFACAGFSPLTIVNVYAVEPDGRSSGLNIYGFFPTEVKTDINGTAGFKFVTEFPALFSVPPGDYTFVVHELVPDGGGAIAAEVHIPLTVTASPRPLVGATLTASAPYFLGPQLDPTFDFIGTGYKPGEIVNVWVTQPPAAQCSGIGIDQLTLGALGAGSSSLWVGPDDVKADSNGNIAFTIEFHTSACRGVHTINARALGSGAGAQTDVLVNGNIVRDANASVFVSPSSVPAYGSSFVVSGTGFPSNTGVNCWFTRPDGRVLTFINVDAQTDASGSFSAGARLDDFPPYTSTEPGWWTVTCATPSRSALGSATFLVYGLVSDP